jgi:branched-chain amino acid transport system ATP-binding protein
VTQTVAVARAMVSRSDVTVPALELVAVSAGYGRTTVLRGVTITVPAGKIVALLGPNGAGKTTLLRTAAGLVRPVSGTVHIGGTDVTDSAPNRRTRAGLCLVPEGRGIFRSLTVRENLRIQIPKWSQDVSIDGVLGVFPILRERLSQTAGTMSGGQQQMLALARSYLSNPRVVLLDEVSMGLAPKVVDEIFDAIGQLASTGTALLLVEQYVNRAMKLADTVVLLDRGAVAFSGVPSELDQDDVLRGYLALGGSGPRIPRRRSCVSNELP